MIADGDVASKERHPKVALRFPSRTLTCPGPWRALAPQCQCKEGRGFRVGSLGFSLATFFQAVFRSRPFFLGLAHLVPESGRGQDTEHGKVHPETPPEFPRARLAQGSDHHPHVHVDTTVLTIPEIPAKGRKDQRLSGLGMR